MTTTLLGLFPFTVTFMSSFLWSYRFGYPLIPRLFGLNSIDLKTELNMDINLDNDPSFRKPTVHIVHSLWLIRLYRVMFSCASALSLNLIKLILCEIINFGEKDARFVAIQLDLNLLTYFLTLFLPGSIISIVVNQTISFFRLRIMVGLVVFLGWLVVLNRFGSLASLNQDSFTELKLSQISMIGITAMACLSGIGSITTPYYSILKTPRLLSEADLNNVMETIKTTDNLLNLRSQELKKFQVLNGGTTYNQPDNALAKKGKSKLSGLMHKVQSFSSLVGVIDQEQELTNEIDNLTKMKGSLYQDLAGIQNRLNEQKNSYTLSGRLVLLGKRLFSIYCLYRLVNMFFIRIPSNYFFESDNAIQKDALAITITKLIGRFTVIESQDEAALANQLSFVLSGGLFIGSFSGVLTTFSSFSRMLPFSFTHSRGKEPDRSTTSLRSLIIGELLGTYVLSTALLLRSNLPVSLSGQVSNALGKPLEVGFIDNWFDKIFSISAIVTIVGIIINNHLNEDEFASIDKSS